MIVNGLREVFEYARKPVRAIGFVERLTKSRQLPQETQSRPSDFQYGSCFACGDRDGGVALNTGKHCHFTKTSARLKLVNFSSTNVWVVDKDFQSSFHADIESISAPFTL